VTNALGCAFIFLSIEEGRVMALGIVKSKFIDALYLSNFSIFSASLGLRPESFDPLEGSSPINKSKLSTPKRIASETN
jgi:hypothetical protein